MNTNNRNPWDGRRPSKDRWWESDENEDEYEMPDTKSTSPTAIQNTKQWIEKPPNENSVVKNCKVCTVQKPQDVIDICKTDPCLCMELKSVIRSNIESLTDDVCNLYDRWLSGPMAADLKFHDLLLTLIGHLKKLINELQCTTGKHVQLELLIKRYDECRDKYQTLLTQVAKAGMSRKNDNKHLRTDTERRDNI